MKLHLSAPACLSQFVCEWDCRMPVRYRLELERVMLIRWKSLILAVVVIGITTLVVTGWLVFAPSPGPFSAEDILHPGRVDPSVLATYKFSIDTRFTVHVEGGPEHQEIHTEAAVVVDEGMHVTATENGNYGETLLLDGAHYHRESDAGPWEQWPALGIGPATTNLPSPRDHFQILDSLTDVSQEGEEVLWGVRVNEITGTVDMAQQVKETWGDAVAGAAGGLRAQMLAGTVTVTAWVGTEDGLLHAYTQEGSFPAVGDLFAYRYSMDVRFSHFNEPLELPSPSSAQ